MNEALLDAARHDPDVLMSLSKATALAVVEELLRRDRVQMEMLLSSVLRSQHQAVLLPVIANHCNAKPEVLYQVALALYKAPGEVWDGFDWRDMQYVVDLFDKTDLFSALAMRNHEVLSDSEHPLFSLLSSDAYWERVVVRVLDQGKYAMAWETAKHALRGFHDKGASSWQISDYGNDFPSGDHTHQVSTETFGKMVAVIFSRMAAARLVSAVIEKQDQELDTWSTNMPRYQGIRSDSKKIPRPASIRIELPGYMYVRRFVVEEQWSRGKLRILLSPEGVMVIRIARYFAEQKWEAARQRWRQMCLSKGVNPDLLERN